MTKRGAHSTELDRLLRTAREDVPSPDEQRALESAVLSAVHSGVRPAPELLDPPQGGSGPIGSLVAKLLVGVGVVGVVAIGISRLGSEHRAEKNPELRPAASTVLSGAPASGAPSPSDTGTAQPLPSTNSSRSQAPSPFPSDVETSSPMSSARKPPSQGAPSETSLIEQAHRKLKSAPAQALALTETHRRLYPQGILAQEREVIAIEALSRLGRSKAAEQRADSYRAGQPDSIHESRLRTVLGDAGTESKP